LQETFDISVSCDIFVPDDNKTTRIKMKLTQQQEMILEFAISINNTKKDPKLGWRALAATLLKYDANSIDALDISFKTFIEEINSNADTIQAAQG